MDDGTTSSASSRSSVTTLRSSYPREPRSPWHNPSWRPTWIPSSTSATREVSMPWEECLPTSPSVVMPRPTMKQWLRWERTNSVRWRLAMMEHGLPTLVLWLWPSLCLMSTCLSPTKSTSRSLIPRLCLRISLLFLVAPSLSVVWETTSLCLSNTWNHGLRVIPSFC